MLYSYPFFDELCKNIYAEPEPFSELNKQALEQEIKLDSSWQIVCENNNETMNFAADDLHYFLKCHTGDELKLIDKDNDGKNIVLLLDDALTEYKSESYCLKIMSQKIIITGVDGSGVMYGVFRLQEIMRRNHAAIVKLGEYSSSPMLKNRISRSPSAFFHGVELDYIDSAYTDNYLQKMAHYYINGIWLHAHMRDLVKTKLFPDLGNNAITYMKLIRRISERAAKYGIKIFIYCQEPMGMHKNNPFWDNNLDIQGHFAETKNSYAMCTSTQKVKDFLFEGTKQLFNELPELGGLIVISSSEFNSHCFIGVETNCKRCKQRTKVDVTTEVLNLMNAGAKAAREDAEIIAWNWSWWTYQDKIINKLDDSINIIADFERGANRSFDGIEHILDEYSLSYIGPSERFMEVVGQVGNKRKIYGKLQLGVTHEIATVPYFPVKQIIAQKFHNMKKLELEGIMECWNFGNILSRNIEVSNLLAWENDYQTTSEILKPIAARDFGEVASDDFVEAWQKFCDATDHYPFDIPFIYYGALNYGGAYPLIFEKLNKKPPSSWHLFGEIEYQQDFAVSYSSEWGDDIDVLCAEFGRECSIDSFRLMTSEWGRGVEIMRNALAKVPELLKTNAKSEINVCTAIYSQFVSTYNFLYFINLRDIMIKTEKISHKRSLLYKLRKIALDEIENALTLKECATTDNRLGFHGEAFGYFYNAEKIDKKIEITKQSIAQIEQEIMLCRK